MEIRNQISSFLLNLTAKLFMVNSFLYLDCIFLTFFTFHEETSGQFSVTLATVIRQLMRYAAGKTMRWYR